MTQLRYALRFGATSRLKDDPFGCKTPPRGGEGLAMELRLARATVAIAAVVATCGMPVRAQTLPAGASPSPSPAPTPSDPCGSILSIVTRPTVTTSVCTVRLNQGVVESGYTNTIVTGPGGGNTINYPQSFVRFGVGPHMELAFSPPSFNRSSVGGVLASGTADMNFGAKWELGYNAKALWGAGFLISAPTGSPGFTAGASQYSGQLNWGYTFSSVFAAAGTVSFNTFGAANAEGVLQQYSAFVPSVTFTGALPGGPSQLFAEYVYYSHAGPGLPNKSLIDFGYVRDFGAHVQFDVEYGIQPTVINGQKQHYFGAGLSFMS